MTSTEPKPMETAKRAKNYIAQSLMLCVILVAVGIVVERMTGLNDLFTPFIVSTIYSLVFDVAEITVWTRVAKKSAEALTTFFMAVSGARFLLALAVMLVYYLVAGRAAMPQFLAVFLAYYVVMLAHHVAFFANRRGATPAKS